LPTKRETASAVFFRKKGIPSFPLSGPDRDRSARAENTVPLSDRAAAGRRAFRHGEAREGAGEPWRGCHRSRRAGAAPGYISGASCGRSGLLSDARFPEGLCASEKVFSRSDPAVLPFVNCVKKMIYTCFRRLWFRRDLLLWTEGEAVVPASRGPESGPFLPPLVCGPMPSKAGRAVRCYEGDLSR